MQIKQTERSVDIASMNETLMTNLQASRTSVITWEGPTAAVQTGKTNIGWLAIKGDNSDAERKTYPSSEQERSGSTHFPCKNV
jgi:hypothetical protein